jgi:hypothetical protein
MNPKEWIPSLFTYGPFAILPLLVFVVERILHSRKKHAEQAEKKTYRILYVSNWIVILGSIVYCVIFWTVTYGGKPEIIGTIENLSNREILATTQADLFLNKKYKTNSFSDYQWRLVSDKRFPDNTKVSLSITVSKPDTVKDGRKVPTEPDLWEYKLPIESYFYKEGVLLKRKQDKLFLVHNGVETELKGELLGNGEVPSPEGTGASWEILPVAHAQSAQTSFSKEDFTIGLESPDIIVRRRARADLAKQDPVVILPWIDQVLNEKSSSYRLRLGVIVALNGIPQSTLSVDRLPLSTISALQIAVGDPDYTLRNEAVNFLNRYDLVPVVIYEHIDGRGKSQAYAEGKYRANRNEFGNLPNDSASALHVGPGFLVKLCEHEGTGSGAGKCKFYGTGWHKLTALDLADLVSYISVSKQP